MSHPAATCDTSVVVAAFLSWHEQHEQARQALLRDVTAVPAHVLAEAFNVLTRLPAPHPSRRRCRVRLPPTAASPASRSAH
ncbi:MAG: PIN domain-containing protein [Dermatophilaceae bacterium]